MSDLRVEHTEASIACIRCKDTFIASSIDHLCFDENGHCQKCRAELSGKYADGKSLMLGVDMVNHPPHYKDASGVGCTEVVKHMMYFGGACFKYLYRCGNKWDDIGDLKKAVRCAELAEDDRFITDESWLRAMYQVAIHRDEHIQDAMFAIRCQQWTDVIDCILAEIARLESEQQSNQGAGHE